MLMRSTFAAVRSSSCVIPSRSASMFARRGYATITTPGTTKPENTVRILTVDGTCSNYQVKAKADKHSLTIDEPKNVGGSDSGPDPLRTQLAALVGCMNATARMYAKDMNVDLGDVKFTIKGTYDAKGFHHPEEVSAQFSKVVIDAEFATSQSQEKLSEIAKKVENTCPISRMFKASGCKVDTNWKVASK
eukprot:TRINITY_DN551_c0_g1_i1.p1 TRINITY_DN551_c0_g1~~TRINITY_DN551_c0_g1_i1.p1  ORF type:complete len:190 (-),score=56.07 TRINITY_DN551_c0_g1_i1:43-612(-)